MPIDEAYAPLFATIQRTGLLLVAGLVLSFLAGLFLARNMVVPIQALSAASSQMIPEDFMAGEYRSKLASLPACRPQTPARLGPVMFLSGSSE